MANDEKPVSANSPSKRISNYLYFGSLYFVCVGVLYLWGYWPSFGVNILQYLSISDVVKATAYPIASVFVFSVVGMVIAETIGLGRNLPPGMGRDTPIGRFLHKVRPFIVFVYVLGTATLWVYGPVEKWWVLPWLVATPVALAAKERGFFSELRDDSTRTIAVYIAAALPAFAYGLGRLSADEILTGKKYSYVVSGAPGFDNAAGVPNEGRLRFVGHAGDYEFLFEPVNRRLVIFKFESGKAMVLGRSEPSSTSSTLGPSRTP